MATRAMRCMASLVLASHLVTACAIGAPTTADANQSGDVGWMSLARPLLTPDGSWLAYMLVPSDVSGEAQIVVRSTAGDVERRFNVSNSTGPSISPSGRWLAFLSSPQGSRTKSLSFVEMASGKRQDETAVIGFAFVGATDDVITLEDPGAGSAEQGLAMLRIADRSRRTLGTATSFAVNQQGTAIAWSGRDGLKVAQLPSGKSLVLDGRAQCSYSPPVWSPSGRSVASLRKCESSPVVIVTGTVTARGLRSVHHEPQGWKGFPTGSEISMDEMTTADLERRAPLTWRQDESGLLLGIRTPAPQHAGPTKQNLSIWHWADSKLPTQKKLAAGGERSYWGYVDLRKHRYLPIEDSSKTSTQLQDRGGRILVYDTERYSRPDTPNLIGTTRSLQTRDYYVIDLDRGTRFLLLEGLPVLPLRATSISPTLSPDGTRLLYQENGDYRVVETASGVRRNLTAGLDTQFYFDENDRNRRQLKLAYWMQDSPLQAWSSDGRYVLVSDYFDIWMLPLKGGAAVRVTPDGRRSRLAYQLNTLDALSGSLRRPSDVPVIDVERAIYFHVTELDSGSTAFAHSARAAAPIERTPWQQAEVRYYKAANAGIFVSSRMSSGEDPDYYCVDSSYRATRRLTEINPIRRRLPRQSPSRFLPFDTDHGDQLHAVLHLPVDYQPGQRYPTVVYVYESQSELLHIPLQPPNEIFRWISSGYAVLMPDIQPRLNAAGAAALESVLAAVNVAVETGIVDKARLGLLGYSHGGFETFYIIANTNLFKAAVPQAGITNILSVYGGVFEDKTPWSFSAEHEQPYLAGPWWQHWNAFIENSALFRAQSISTPLLIAHGTLDKAVPFSQALEMFNTLRRIGSKEVVLLEYENAGHIIEGDDRTDLQRRTEQFIDHFLKAAPAPSWWTDGTSWPSGSAPVVQ